MPDSRAAERIRRHDVVVVGAGPTGCVAALACAREGMDVLLVEKLPFLGGTATAAMVGPWMAFHAEGRPIVAGIAQELVGRLVRWGGSPGHLPDPLGVCGSMTPFDTELLKILLFEMAGEAGVKLALHTFATGLTRGAGGAIESVSVADKSGASRLAARVFVDTSGDADLAHWAGVPTDSGRGGASGAAPDRLTQPMTAVFKVGGVDFAAIREYVLANPGEFVLGFSPEEYVRLPYLAVSGFFRQVRDARAAGELTIARDRVLFFGLTRPGEVTINMTRVQGLRAHDAADLSAAEAEGARQVKEALDFLRRRIPGFAESFLLQTATHVGIRETRRIVGRYVLTREDVLGGARFDDSVALGGFPIDIHAASGAGVDCPQAAGRAYQIPFRCLVPPGVPNLLVAGRCLSATFEAHASARITPTCMALGQAAGIAAAAMVRRSAPGEAVPVREIQARLDAAGALRR
jgi:hypothetical protein